MLQKLLQQTPFLMARQNMLIPLAHSMKLVNSNAFNFAKQIQKLPQISDSFTSGQLKEITIKQGQLINQDDPVLCLETDKIEQDILAPITGVITKFFVKAGDEVKVGDQLFEIDDEAKPTVTSEEKEEPKESPQEEAPKEVAKEEPVKKEEPIKKEEPVKKEEPAKQQKQQEAKPQKKEESISLEKPKLTIKGLDRSEKREKINKIRKTIAQRLKDSQNVSASLTTFQEIDMFNASQIRKEFQEQFEKKHGIKLGFMSFFIRASAICLKRFPMVNAVIDGDEIVFRNYIDISIAVATPKGLIVPVIRNCEHLSLADIEKEVKYFGDKGKLGKIEMDEIKGGTFTISNGGVFGSLFSTPIINPPQSGVLGLHGIKMRPAVVGNEVKPRPMMYVALTYDHRLVDGKDAAQFLKQVSLLMEDPRRMLLDI